MRSEAALEGQSWMEEGHAHTGPLCLHPQFPSARFTCCEQPHLAKTQFHLKIPLSKCRYNQDSTASILWGPKFADDPSVSTRTGRTKQTQPSGPGSTSPLSALIHPLKSMLSLVS